MIKAYLDLSKSGITLFVLISGFVGWAASHPIGETINWLFVIQFVVGLYLVSSGSFVLNQVQEAKIDARMTRTASRPIASGALSWQNGLILSLLMLGLGLAVLYNISFGSFYLSVITIILYNGIYTMYWKKHWAFGAVPGAIPGALPVVIGYAVNNGSIWSTECLYLFLISFLWQMPHFWCLAIRYREDYRKGGFPVLPTVLGVETTLRHIGFYLSAYLAVTLGAPLFFNLGWIYFLVVALLSIKLFYEFMKYFKSEGEKSWLPFFLWVNGSLFIFLGGPIFHKWLSYAMS